MAKRRLRPGDCFVIENDRPLYGVPGREDGRDVTYYFAGNPATETTTTMDEAPQSHITRARSLAGAWSDLDWEEAITALEQIRKGSPPTPPIGE